MTMQVAVELNYDNNFERAVFFDVDPEDTVGHLKDRIRDEEGVGEGSDICRLYHEEQPLADDLNLTDYLQQFREDLRLQYGIGFTVVYIYDAPTFLFVFPPDVRASVVVEYAVKKKFNVPTNCGPTGLFFAGNPEFYDGFYWRFGHKRDFYTCRWLDGKQITGNEFGEMMDDPTLIEAGVTNDSALCLSQDILSGSGESLQIRQVSLCDWEGTNKGQFINGMPLHYGKVLRDVGKKVNGNWYKFSDGKFFPSSYVKTEIYYFEPSRTTESELSFKVQPPDLPPMPTLHFNPKSSQPDIFKLKIGDSGFSFVQLEMKVEEHTLGEKIPLCFSFKHCLVPPTRVHSAVISVEFSDNSVIDVQPSSLSGPEVRYNIKSSDHKSFNITVGPEIQGYSVGDIGWGKGKEKAVKTMVSSSWRIYGMVVAPCTARWTFEGGGREVSKELSRNQANLLPTETDMSLSLARIFSQIRVRMKVEYGKSKIKTKELKEKREYPSSEYFWDREYTRL